MLTVILRGEGEVLLVETGKSKWFGKALGKAAQGTVIPTGYSLTLAGVTAVRMGALRWRQHQLANETVNFLRATAPRDARRRK